MPNTFKATTEAAEQAWPAADWWRGFHSPALDQLIEQARTENFDIAAAVARVRQADAQVRIAGAALLPDVSAAAGASWQHEGLAAASSTLSRLDNTSYDYRIYSAGLSVSYELDFWGRNRAERSAAVGAALSSRFDQQTVALSVITDVASTWFAGLALADRLAVAQRNLADAERILAAVRGRADAGTASALDIAEQEALVASERANIPNLTNQMEQQVIALGILTGQPPERITVKPDTLTSLTLPPVVAGLPSGLLTRRPDIAAAEAQLTAQHFNITAARAALFPTVTLTGSAGFQAPALRALVTPGGALATLAAGVTQPIFDGGALRGELAQTKGRYDELLADYRKAVVQGFTDVDNALTAWRYATQQEVLQVQAEQVAQRAADIARAQMQAGTVDITAVLTTETTLFNDQDTLVQVRLVRLLALLNLYKALGGGWALPDASP
jgi:NodT family efflux transporter outer membrane factor (OMF) lipoprotein